MRTRYRAQGRTSDLPVDPAVDLYDRLPEGTVRPYVCRVDGEFASGILVLDDDRRVSRWQGGVANNDVDPPVNDLLDWRVMTDAIDSGVDCYDLVGADTPRVNEYKAKFDPRLRTFHVLEHGQPLDTRWPRVRSIRSFWECATGRRLDQRRSADKYLLFGVVYCNE